MATFTRRDELHGAEFVNVSVSGEWSFAETLRHLVLATDVWLRRAVLHMDQPFHPIGLAGPGAEDEGLDMSVFATATPSYTEVLEVRAGRVAMVRDFLAEEEWEHHRFAVRDLDAIERSSRGGDREDTSWL